MSNSIRAGVRPLAAAAVALISGLLAAHAATEDSWPQWGGPNRDFNVSAPGLATRWPEPGPQRLWSRELGDGYSGVVVDGNRLYTTFRRGEDEVVVALDAGSGETVWEHRYPAPHHESQTAQFGGGPNATPLIVGNRLITIGFTSKMHALDRQTGKVLWSHDLVADLAGQVMQFGYSASPLAHGDRVIALVGGKEHGAVGFDLADGTIAWKTAAVEISYASPQVIDVDGQEQLVFMTPSEVVGFDLASGALSWRYSHENQYRNNCAGPWWGEGNLLFISSQGDVGSRTLKLTQREGRTTVEEVARDRKLKVFHSSGVRTGDWIYLGSHEYVAAYDVRAGELGWKLAGFPETNLLLAGDKLVLLDENGQLALATASAEGVEVHASLQLLEKPAWTAPTLVGTRLFVRGNGSLIALELGEPPPATETGP